MIERMRRTPTTEVCPRKTLMGSIETLLLAYEFISLLNRISLVRTKARRPSYQKQTVISSDAPKIHPALVGLHARPYLQPNQQLINLQKHKLTLLSAAQSAGYWAYTHRPSRAHSNVWSCQTRRLHRLLLLSRSSRDFAACNVPG